MIRISVHFIHGQKDFWSPFLGMTWHNAASSRHDVRISYWIRWTVTLFDSSSEKNIFLHIWQFRWTVVLLPSVGRIIAFSWSYYCLQLVILLPSVGSIITFSWSYYYFQLIVLLPSVGSIIAFSWSYYCLQLVVLLPSVGFNIAISWTYYPLPSFCQPFPMPSMGLACWLTAVPWHCHVTVVLPSIDSPPWRYDTHTHTHT